MTALAKLSLVPPFLVTLVAMVTSQGYDDLGTPNVVPAHGHNPFDIDDYTHHVCRRECDGKPMLCHYYFLLEHFDTMGQACHDCPENHAHCKLPQCVPGNGKRRGILSVNRMMPGPFIDVCEGDTIQVAVDNRMNMGEATTIHWHGFKMRGTPHEDGVAMVTECPIASWQIRKYKFNATDPGTHYWHAHSAQQRAEGIFGGMVVGRYQDPHKHLYDHDKAEHMILLSDWFDKPVSRIFIDDVFNEERALPTGILVNGLGFDPKDTSLPKTVFSVKQGQRYRFRVLLNGIFNCPIYISVESHKLQMIATDGQDIDPVWVDRFMVYSGERWDFVLHANQSVGNYWVKFKGRGRCMDVRIFQTAILRYDGAEEEFPDGEVTYHNIPETGVVLNGVLTELHNPDDGAYMLNVSNLSAFKPTEDEELTTAKPDRQYFMSLGTAEIPDPRFELPDFNGRKTQRVRPTNQQIDYISSRLPPAPVLTEYNSVPQELFCNNNTIKEDCTKEMCECVHLVPYKLGDIVEIVMFMYKQGSTHSMHMHGHSYTVVAQHFVGHDLTQDMVKEMDKRGEIKRNRGTKAVRKDTTPVHYQTVVVIRFRANNPGFWFMHCHIEFHTDIGMNLILQEGELSDMPPPPPGYPRCGITEDSISPPLGGRKRPLTSNAHLSSSESQPSDPLKPSLPNTTEVIDEDAEPSGDEGNSGGDSPILVILTVSMACIMIAGVFAFVLHRNHCYVREKPYQPLRQLNSKYTQI